jgi:hypothetical protein
VTTYPDKTWDYIKTKKASNFWSDAPFSNLTEQPPAGKVISGLSGDTDVSRTQDKDKDNNDVDGKNLGKGGSVENLIKIVEKSGKIRQEYQIEESAYKGSGSAIMYDYNGRTYEIVTWNDDAQEHKAGEKTIAIGEIKKNGLLEGIDWLITGKA